MIFEQLDDDQRAAVLATEPATLVRAQVGSGKTTVLVHRAAYLHLVGGVPLERIAIVTFTNRAADEIRTRLDALIGRTTTRDEHWLIGTFHGVASALLCRAGRRFTILDDDQAIDLAVSVAKRLRVKPGRRATLRDRLASDPALAELAAAVIAERRARGALDFDDLIEHATALLADQSSPAEHVLVDELQDCEPRDLAFLSALRGRGYFAVGDPLQSIYGWRGATPELFAQAAAGCRVRELPRSYRSTQTVLAGARAVLGAQPTELGELVPVRGPGARISIVRHHDITAEAAYLAARLGELHTALRNVAVLCRLRSQVADLVAALTTRGVPCVYDLDGVVATEAGDPAGVRVLTIHAAKGLEFDHVFVSGANVGVLPLLSRDPDAPAARHADPAEERRLLFVALTRARETVEVSYHACPHAHGAFAIASPLLALLPANVVAWTDRPQSPAVSERPPSPAVLQRPPSPAVLESRPSPAVLQPRPSLAVMERSHVMERPPSPAVLEPPQSAAVLERPPSPAVMDPPTSAWRVGQRVRHARYGQGTITSIDGDTIACDFGKLGSRAFPRALCPLT